MNRAKKISRKLDLARRGFAVQDDELDGNHGLKGRPFTKKPVTKAQRKHARRIGKKKGRKPTLKKGKPVGPKPSKLDNMISHLFGG